MTRGTAFAAGAAARVWRAALCGVAALCFAASGAVKAAVTDISGQTYDVTSMRFTNDSTLMRFVTGSKLAIDCGGAKMELPLKAVKSIKINPKRISSIDGRLHFGIELMLRDSTVIGGGGNCGVPAGNGIAGKSSKGKFALPFEKLRHVYIFGKEDAGKKQPAKKGGAAEENSVTAEQPEKEDDEENAPDQK